MLRAVQLGLSIQDLDELEESDVLDMLTESLNDEYNYPYKATQEDFDKFKNS